MDKELDFIKLFAGPLIGFLASVTLFRARFTSIEKDIEAAREARGSLAAMIESDRKHDREVFTAALESIRQEIERECGNTAAFQKRIERRQTVSLEIIAALAHKTGVRHRALGSDALVELLNSETGE
jgi:hypothetical protein